MRRDDDRKTKGSSHGRWFTALSMLAFAVVFVALWVHVMGALEGVRGFRGGSTDATSSGEVDYWSQVHAPSSVHDALA
ncbi:MAG: hypothetical protein H6733_04540 [Alphaproteobacteria bacterium]|nr:hypothetical protein [Alphaproteobacteria bacterium]